MPWRGIARRITACTHAITTTGRCASRTITIEKMVHSEVGVVFVSAMAENGEIADILKAMAWDCRWGPTYGEWTCTSYDVDYCRSLKNLPDVQEIVDHLQCMCPCHLPDGERLWAVKERMT